MIKYNQGLIKSILFLTLAIASNFVGTIFNCKMQYHLTNNIYLKHIILFIIIFFTINYSSDDTKINPIKHVKNTLIIWLCYILFIRQNIICGTICIISLFILYFMDIYIDYYKSLNNKTKVANVTKMRNILYHINIFVLIVGFLLYLNEKRIDYKNSFSLITFILGKPECNSMIKN